MADLSAELAIAGPCPASFFPRTNPPSRRFLLPFPRARRDDPQNSGAEGFRGARFGFSDPIGAEERPKKKVIEEEEEERWSGKGRWWSGELYEDDDDYDDFFDDEPDQPWENVWIFKMFKSYGYLLPAIVASLLLASGPKAFLMAMALPLGQSALSLVADKLWARTSPDETQLRWPSSRKKPVNGGSPRSRQRTEAKQAESFKPTAAPQPEPVSGRRKYGGWDELDPRPPPPPPPTPGKLSKRGRGREAPLLLRLIMAVFPFLGSWTRFL
ncbi:uncharacterized protein LOC144710740 [Wolffia australiana]